MKRNRTIANQLAQIGLLLAGASAHAEQLAKVGLDAAFIANFQNRYRELLESHQVQQALKARLMEQNKSRVDQLTELNRLYRYSRKMVKLELDRASWIEFGIGDQQ